MVDFSAVEIEDWTSGNWCSNNLPTQIKGFSIDSRTIKEDEIFIAIKTELRDGHEFVDSAKRAGASAAIVSRNVDSGIPQLLVKNSEKALAAIGKENRLKFPGDVIAIVGSFGKTTTKEILKNLLGDSFFATEGNLNNYLGVPLTLSQLNQSFHSGAIIEAGINKCGEMEFLGDMIRPESILFTGVGPVHLEQLKDLETIAAEKLKIGDHSNSKELKLYCPVDCFKYKAFNQLEMGRIISVYDEAALPSVSVPESVETVFYTINPAGNESLEMTFKSGRHSGTSFKLPFMSDGLVQCCALALLLTLDRGVEIDKLESRLRDWKPSELRGKIHRYGNTKIFLDCYNANPASMSDSFKFFTQKFKEEPQLLVLGSMNELGDNVASFHYETAKELGLVSKQKYILIGKNRSDYLKGLVDAGVNLESIREYESLPHSENWIESWKGAVFVKGSREYRLERVLNIVKEGVC